MITVMMLIIMMTMIITETMMMMMISTMMVKLFPLSSHCCVDWLIGESVNWVSIAPQIDTFDEKILPNEIGQTHLAKIDKKSSAQKCSEKDHGTMCKVNQVSIDDEIDTFGRSRQKSEKCSEKDHQTLLSFPSLIPNEAHNQLQQ